MEEVLKLLKDYNKLDLRHFKFRRKNIPKPGTNKMRPLGIPTESWRLFQTGLNMILLIWLKLYQHPHQHGFTPSKGTTTAWNQILTDVIPSKYIYEFDLEKFFDRINLDFLCDQLQKMGVPLDLALLMVNWSRIPPLMDKEKITMVKNGEVKLEDIQEPSTDLTWTSEEEHKIHFTQHNSLKLDEYNYFESVRARTGNWSNSYCYMNGVAQGSPLSPTLSTIILVPLLFLNKQKVDVIMYADDGLLYSNKPFNPDEVLNFPINSGIIAHPEGEKSKWIKQDGKWLNSLKFTGKRFTPHCLQEAQGISSLSKSNGNIQDGLISNATKTPKPFLFDKTKAFGLASLFDKWYSVRNRIKGFHTKSGQITEIGGSYNSLKMNKIGLNESYSGYIDSRIYLGSYQNLPIDPSWNTYKVSQDSWSYKVNNGEIHINFDSKDQEITLFTASSFATNYLANYLRDNGLNKARFTKPNLNIHQLVNVNNAYSIFDFGKELSMSRIRSI